MEGGPFRERPKFLLCPHCGEMLDRAFESVLTCLRCEGVWINPITLEKAFEDSKWPAGHAMWWRNALHCPECAAEGVTRQMTAAMSGGVLVDRCATHGVWLDRGELGRLMGGDTADERGDDDLDVLREKLAAPGLELEQLLKRRAAWRSDLEQRRRSASEYRAWLETEERRRIELEQARARMERERVEAERDADRLRAEAAREREQTLQRLGDARQGASAEVGRLESELIVLRERIRGFEAELEGARGRLRAIDDQLQALTVPASA